MLKTDKKLIAYTTCINCNKRFGLQEIDASRQIKKTGDSILVHITCNRCQSSMLLGLVNGKVAGIIGLATDLCNNDIERMINNQRITSDELINLSDVINGI
jgi:hypothetical protein